MNERDTRHRVVILGGGFAGLNAALRLKRGPFEVTVVDRRNFHLFQPLLYQVATGGLSPGDVASPIRRALRRHPNTRVVLAEVVGLDAEARRVHLRDGSTLDYDSLIVATGATHHYFGNDAWEAHAPGLKTIEDATDIRARILLAFERAERATTEAERRAHMNFVIVGAGPTGVELAGAICELARDTLRHDFRRIDPRDARVVLIEGTDRVLPPYPPELSAKAARSLRRLGAELRLNTMVREVDAEGVTMESESRRERLDSRCVLWAAGVRASSLSELLEREAGARLDRAGRVHVEDDCTIKGRPEIFCLGDIAHFAGPDGAPLPGVAPVAMQQGRYAADVIVRRERGDPVAPFRYRDRGSLATIGRRAAVADFGRLRFSGWLAWLLWSVVHVFFLIEYENRVLVSIRWIWNYLTRNRGTRLITARPGPGSQSEPDTAEPD